MLGFNTISQAQSLSAHVSLITLYSDHVVEFGIAFLECYLALRPLSSTRHSVQYSFNKTRTVLYCVFNREVLQKTLHYHMSGSL